MWWQVIWKTVAGVLLVIAFALFIAQCMNPRGGGRW
jgi:hypothetical protein